MDYNDIHDAIEESNRTRFEGEFFPEEPDLLHDALDGAIEPWYTPAPVRMPDVSTYNPLARLWQSEELDDYIDRRKEAFDTIEQHRCKRTQEAIVDGKRTWICDVCLPCLRS